MSGRILMATVAALALAIPAVAQDAAAPSNTKQQMKQGAQQEAAPEGATEQAPAMTEEQPAEEQAPAMTEEAPTEQPADQQMAEEPTPPEDMKFLEVQEEEQFLANDEVIGAEVVNDAGEPVGSIADLVMDQDQKLVGVVLSVGGFLGVGDKWVAVPIEQISFPGKEEPARLLAAVTEEQLTNAPDFTTRAALEAEEAAQTQGQGAQQPPPPTAPAQ
jgi:sporulation protein YlmC with PRC-barrel domain